MARILHHAFEGGTAMTFTLKNLAFAASALLGTTLAASAAPPPDAVTLHAVAVNMSNVGETGAFPVDIGITRWSTDEDRARLKDALRKGSDAVTNEIQKMKRVGFIRHSSGGLGWSLRYARRIELPNGGYRIVFATDRPMSFNERVNRPRSAEYDLVVGEVRIGSDGKGEGTLASMATVTYNESEGTIEVEDYASQPLRLSAVTEMDSKRSKEPAREDVK
jgi:hypothetical protein